MAGPRERERWDREKREREEEKALTSQREAGGEKNKESGRTMESARWPPTTSSRVAAAVSGNFRVHARGVHLPPRARPAGQPGGGGRCGPGSAAPRRGGRESAGRSHGP